MAETTKTKWSLYRFPTLLDCLLTATASDLFIVFVSRLKRDFGKYFFQKYISLVSGTPPEQRRAEKAKHRW